MSTQQLLSGLLVVQVALAALTWMPSSGGEPVEARKLLPSGGNAVTKLTVARSGDGAEKPVELVSEGGNWLIASEGNYPADADKVAEVLDALGKIELKAPIATQATSFAKLKVADDDFGKKVTFTADGKEHTLLVGAAASKAVYLRVDGGQEVYQIKGFSEFVFKDAARSYWKGNYVEFEKEDASAITVTKPGWSLSFNKSGETWTAAGAPAGMIARQDKVSELVTKASALRLSEPVGKDEKPEYGLGAEGTKVEFSATAGDQTTTGSFVIGNETDGKYYAKASGNPFIVTVPKYAVQPFLDATPETLLEAGAAPAPAEAPPAPPPGGGAPPDAPPPPQ